MKPTLIVAITGLLLLAFSPPSAADDPPAPITVVLKINQPVTVDHMELTLLDVGDSRCPLSVVCFWEGMASGRIRALVRGIDPEEHVIHTHAKFDMKFEYAGYNVAMVNVTPYPATPDPIDPGDYAVAVRVTRALNTVPTETGTWGAIKELYR